MLPGLTAILLICLCLPLVAGQSTPSATAAPTQAARQHSMVLWYRQPARQWVEALPIGNGRLGGMVFGGTDAEHIQLNEDTVWAGEKRNRDNPEALKNLPEVRRLLFAGK